LDSISGEVLNIKKVARTDTKKEQISSKVKVYSLKEKK
jgi:hypothetical protein